MQQATDTLADTAALIRTETEESLVPGYEPDPGPWCRDWLYTVIRHVTRNMDIECPAHDYDDEDQCRRPGRYSGMAMHRWTPDVAEAVAGLLQAVADGHQPKYASGAGVGVVYTCTTCAGPWPCGVRAAADAVARAYRPEDDRG